MVKATILYVDDEPDALASMSVGLSDRGFNVLTAESGAAALAVLNSQTADLIIADLRMQPMNGFELFQAIRAQEKFSQTPFFFLTAVDDFLAQKYGQTLGVDAYLVKPIDLDHLNNLIQTKLQLSPKR